MGRNVRKTFIVWLACLTPLTAAWAASLPSVPVPDGYAQGTTGGGNAVPVTVSTAADFKAKVSGNQPGVIIVNGRLNVGDVKIGSNKTILGKDSKSGLHGGRLSVEGENYIFMNLTIGPSGTDAMEVSGAKRVFIHKCEFWDGADGTLDIVRAADFITVSWCKFYYVNQSEHNFPMLIGNGDDATGDRGKLHVTLHHNWFADKCNSRMPRVRFGMVHIYNNYYNSTGNSYCVGLGVHSRIRLENSHFDNTKAPWNDMGGMASDGKIGWKGLRHDNSAQPTFAPNSFPVFEPPYAYAADPAEGVKGLVRAGAGNVFTVASATLVQPVRAAPAEILFFDAAGRLVLEKREARSQVLRQKPSPDFEAPIR